MIYHLLYVCALLFSGYLEASCIQESRAIIFLFGPSCSGKSSLGKALQQELGENWIYLDRDLLLEEHLCTDLTADALLEEKLFILKNKVIIDAQIPWREKRPGECYCLLLPPLEVLLQRDASRNMQLKRNPKRAFYAQKYVTDTYNLLSLMPQEKFDCVLDSSKQPINDEVALIISMVWTDPD